MRLLASNIKCGNASFPHYYLCYYLPLTAGKDKPSLSLLKFKQRIQPDLDTWITYAAELLGSVSLSPDTIILRALRHDEVCARADFPSALDVLGHSLAERLHCRYLPTFVCKTRPTLPGKLLTRRQRQTQLENVYKLSGIPLAEHPPFLLIDDILTTGSTMRALIGALREHYFASPITVFTLTRSVAH